MTPALALIQDNRAAAEFVGATLNESYGHLKGTTKHVARAANGNERTAEGWLQARVCPDVPHFLRLAMQTPALNASVRWLMEHGMNSPEAKAHLNFMQRYVTTHPEQGDQV